MLALTGPVRYDAVVMSVVSDATMYDGAMRFALDISNNLRVKNNQLFDSISDEVQTELFLLATPPRISIKVILISKVILNSTCERRSGWVHSWLNCSTFRSTPRRTHETYRSR